MTAPGRVPPHNLDAERSALGSMLLERSAIDEVATTVTADDFYAPAHGHIFDAIVGLHGQARPVDAITVIDELRRRGLLDAAGGEVAVSELMSAPAAISHATAYADSVADRAVLRRMISVGGEIAEIGYSDPADVAAAVDEAEALLFALATDERRRGARQIAAGVDHWLDRLVERQTSGAIAGVPTGLHDLDDLLLGLQPGQLITIAGRASMGKTAVAVGIALHAARESYPTLLVSLEMTEDEIVGRLVAADGKIDSTAIRSAQVSPRDWARLIDTTDRVRQLPLWIEDGSSQTIMSIRAAARRVASKAGGLALIVVDYLQLVDAVGKVSNREQAVAEVSRGLKRLAGEMAVPVVALSQLNRAVENRADKRPALADLRESGAIENDSDVVILLFRDEYYRPDSPDKGILELIVAKQRNGPVGTAKVAWISHYGAIANMGRI